MSVEIRIFGETATDALQELTTLAAPITVGKQVAPATTAEAPKPNRQRSVSKPETAKPEPEHAEDPAVKGDDAAEEQAEGVDEGPIPTVVELRAKAQEVGTIPEAKKAIKALLDKYGSKSISDVPEDLRAEFLKELEGLA